jgi:hypothetical protein
MRYKFIFLALLSACTTIATPIAQAVSALPFPIFSASYTAGLSVHEMGLSNGSECPDNAKQYYYLAGKGSFSNNLPGLNIFEKLSGTCSSSSGFNKKIGTVLIHSNSAEIWSNCAGVKRCDTQTIIHNGGLIRWVATKSGRKIALAVTGYNLNFVTLLKVANGLG